VAFARALLGDLNKFADSDSALVEARARLAEGQR
jgi:hypothetical protein